MGDSRSISHVEYALQSERLMMKNSAMLATFAVCASLSWSARAHHSVPAEFDLSKPGELTGEITRVWYANPHIRYGFRVTNVDGSTEEWELQASNVTAMRRIG